MRAIQGSGVAYIEQSLCFQACGSECWRLRECDVRAPSAAPAGVTPPRRRRRRRQLAN